MLTEDFYLIRRKRTMTTIVPELLGHQEHPDTCPSSLPPSPLKQVYDNFLTWKVQWAENQRENIELSIDTTDSAAFFVGNLGHLAKRNQQSGHECQGLSQKAAKIKKLGKPLWEILFLVYIYTIYISRNWDELLTPLKAKKPCRNILTIRGLGNHQLYKI